jgi:hypothetical protein
LTHKTHLREPKKRISLTNRLRERPWLDEVIVKEQKIKRGVIFMVLPVVACLALGACTKQSQTKVNDSSTASPVESNTKIAGNEQPKTETRRSTTPPTLAEAEAALQRVYRQAVALDKNKPGSFVAGDFNGDGSEDIAIAVSPAKAKLAEINSEFANWIIIDPKKVALPDAKKAVQPLAETTGPVKIEQHDALLAIIHGYEQEGWRSTEAKQTYLLRGAAGDEMRVVPLRDFPDAIKVRKNGSKSRADIIVEKLSGAQGFLYWIDGKYVWHED